jgi:hypothetical protein
MFATKFAVCNGMFVSGGFIPDTRLRTAVHFLNVWESRSLDDEGTTTSEVVLGGLVVRVLAIRPRFTSSNPAEGDRFYWAIKISSTPSFGREAKPSAPSRNILRHVKKT